MNASERDPELESLLSAPPEELADVGALFDGVKEQIDAAEKKPAYKLQSQPTSRRRLMAFIAFAMVILVTLLTGKRPDLDAYPPSMLALVLGSLGGPLCNLGVDRASSDSSPCAGALEARSASRASPSRRP